MELPAQFAELSPAWREIHAELRRAVGETTYEIWLAPLEVKAYDGAEMVLAAPRDTADWVAKRFGRIVEACARTVVGGGVEVKFAGDDRERRTPPATVLAEQQDRDSRLNPRYTFNQFIIGESNRLAHAAALAVAEIPGQAYNPLFLHAPPGLGKTHLLHAIGNYIHAHGNGATVRYTTVEAFTNHFIGSLGTRSLDRFKQVYRGVDVLLIDDVQFLASKAKTGEEFFHTFNALHETGRQLVLTCDRLPQQLRELEERLRERFESGLVADIAAPDFATRVAILRKRAALDRIELSDQNVLELIATRITDNVRALEGALIRIVAYHSLTGRPIDTELAAEMLEELYPRPRPPSSAPIKQIQKAVCAYFQISVDELLSSTRVARVAWPRHVAIHLAREHTQESLHNIGEAFGGRNHATVLHACRRVTERLTADPQAADDLNTVSGMIARA